MSRYLPSLSTLISLDNVPDSLGFIQDAIDGIVDNIYFDNLNIVGSRYGESKTFNLDLILNKRLGFEIPGTGISLLLNPEETGGGTSSTSFNVTLVYRLGVLRYVNNFRIQNFSFGSSDLIDIILKGLKINNSTLLEQISYHIDNPFTSSAGYDVFTIEQTVDFFNIYYSLYDTENEIIYSDAITNSEIESDLTNAGIPTSQVISDFSITTDYPDGIDTIDDVYSRIGQSKHTGPIDIPDLITALNENYSLTGTPNEIIYVESPETTYDDIIVALTKASITLSQLIIDYIILDESNFASIENAIIGFFKELMLSSGVEIVGLFDPFVQASLNNLNLALEFPRTILNPIDPTTNLPYEDLTIKSLLRFDVGSLIFSTSDGFVFDDEESFSFDKSEIGTTGLVVSFTDAKLDLSTTSNIPEATAAGYPNDFVGVYVKDASIVFNGIGKENPDNPSDSITATNLLVGTGGISGTIKVVDNGVLRKDLGSFALELDVFSITFLQNVITGCSIIGSVTINQFKINNQPAKINIQAQLKDAGDFSITATFPTGFPPLTLPGVFELHVRTLSLGEDNGKFYVETSGTLDFIADVPGLGEVLPKGINISKLRIYEDGSIQFFGGNITLPVGFTLKVGPVKLEVTHMSLGTYSGIHDGHTRSYCYFGFDGMINTGSAGISASGNGIKYYFTVTDNDTLGFDSFVRIDKIEIDITLPNGPATEAAFILNGSLSMNSPSPNASSSKASSEYGGGITVQIPPLGISGGGKMRLDPSIPSFVVDMDLELSTPLLLGSTGLGIYGFRGMVGEHYAINKPDAQSYWEYYKAPQEGINIDKLADKPGYILGAGANIATSYDSGFTFSSKLFLVLGIPDFFALQGQASILSKRLGLDDKTDPPFSALIVIANHSFTGNLSVNYGLPSTGTFAGKVARLTGMLELAFFFNNASGWYINIGKDQPTSARVSANVLTLFNGYAYLMISSQGFKAGAGAQFNFDKSFGPAGVKASAGVEVGAAVSFNPIQIGGYLHMWGGASVHIWKFSLGVNLDVMLAVEAPHPFNLLGTITVTIKVWFVHIHVGVTLSWNINNDSSPLTAPIPVLELPDAATEYNPASAVNILTQDTFPINYVTEIFNGIAAVPAPDSSQWKYDFTNSTAVMEVTIPLDSFIDIELRKPVNPSQLSIGGSAGQLPSGYTELLPPKKGISNQVQHQYGMTALNIYAWNDTESAWKPYQIYEAVTLIVDNNTGSGSIDLGSLPNGYWQFQEPNKFNKIRLMSQNMFSYATQTTDTKSNIDGQNFPKGFVFCYDEVDVSNIIDWTNVLAGVTYADGQTVNFGDLPIQFKGLSGVVEHDDFLNNNCLAFNTRTGTLTLLFYEHITYCKLEFGANKNNLIIVPAANDYNFTEYGTIVRVDRFYEAMYVASSDENSTIIYDNTDQPIDRMYITFASSAPVDLGGRVNIGGYVQLPDEFLPVTSPQFHHEIDADKSLMFAALYHQSFTPDDVLAKEYGDTSGATAMWPLDSRLDKFGLYNGILADDPQFVPGVYLKSVSGEMALQNILAVTGNSEGLFIPANPALNIENESFSYEVTAVFSPFTAGISTLLSKIEIDPVSGDKRGFALHLYQNDPGFEDSVYEDEAPNFIIWATFYRDGAQSGFNITDSYTIDCGTKSLAPTQYRRILVSVDRSAGKLSIYLDRVSKLFVDLPAELSTVTDQELPVTHLNRITFVTEEYQRKKDDSGITPDKFINETIMLNNNINKTIQPVWRPNTTYAVALTTTDTVNKTTTNTSTQIFGFRTAGPIGHFQEQSAIYQALVATDDTDKFKLADLRNYIDYDRSYPDAQSRYDLSKPVFLQNAQINLFFLAPYINAMYSNWNNYQGLSPVGSSLTVSLVDPSGAILSPHLVWTETDTPITIDNYKSLPPDQQILFLTYQEAVDGTCNPHPVSLNRRVNQGSYIFDMLVPNKLYTAVFNAVYNLTGDPNDDQSYQVHKFTFLSSRYVDFSTQINSYVIDNTVGAEKYAIYALDTAFSAEQISNDLLPLLDDNPNNDEEAVSRYAVKFDRLVFGGLQIKNLETIDITNINPVINTDTANNNKTILGLIIRNPEPFNDPKLPVEQLTGTVQMELTKTDGSVVSADNFIYVYARDTSAILITNSAMALDEGTVKLTFQYKVFDGDSYIIKENCVTDAIAIAVE